jgi:hypothetical protein
MDLYHFTSTNRGIYSPFVDGVALGTTIDGYATTGAPTRSTIANIAVSGSMVHTIRYLIATKNASSSAFLGAISGVAMTRTGP